MNEDYCKEALMVYESHHNISAYNFRMKCDTRMQQLAAVFVGYRDMLVLNMSLLWDGWMGGGGGYTTYCTYVSKPKSLLFNFVDPKGVTKGDQRS